ncbi:TetR/AcrR family transcriptional regulator [Litoribacter alkaliphilus]|uniref:TetR/AcrR family transcriptional regulator n=1 Tax=Litoribacter ruber TaxID=702568 RepID=A0AAP2G5J6_9BACT|nr:TetR/AcrR family transcriptional regulator [Litoribacter alkaliphilus]MBS9524618.1 TetR/AcrR family transcriptional regulator [Litoribacter alkaliphilus]
MEIDIHLPKNDKLYLINPEKSALGQKIIVSSISMIRDLGIEEFTFKKLATKIKSNEASVYRYFNNKHNLLVYLISVYWEVLNMKIEFSTEYIHTPKDKLDKVIDILVNTESASPSIRNMDIKSLHDIMISESAKAYLTKKVEFEDKEGYFKSYERLVDTISKIFIEVNKEYEFPRALACNLIETTYEQFYFSKHFQTLTEFQNSDSKPKVKRFLETLMFSVLTKGTLN